MSVITPQVFGSTPDESLLGRVRNVVSRSSNVESQKRQFPSFRRSRQEGGRAVTSVPGCSEVLRVNVAFPGAVSCQAGWLCVRRLLLVTARRALPGRRAPAAVLCAARPQKQRALGRVPGGIRGFPHCALGRVVSGLGGPSPQG